KQFSVEICYPVCYFCEPMYRAKKPERGSDLHTGDTAFRCEPKASFTIGIAPYDHIAGESTFFVEPLYYISLVVDDKAPLILGCKYKVPRWQNQSAVNVSVAEGIGSFFKRTDRLMIVQEQTLEIMSHQDFVTRVREHDGDASFVVDELVTIRNKYQRVILHMH